MGSIKGKEIKIELGVVQDIEKAYNVGGKSQLSGENLRNSTVSTLNKSQESYKIAIKEYQESLRLVNYAIKQSSDLGIEIPTSVTSYQKKNTDAISYCNKRILDIDKAISNIK